MEKRIANATTMVHVHVQNEHLNITGAQVLREKLATIHDRKVLFNNDRRRYRYK